MFNFFLFISGMILAMCISEMIYENSSIEVIYINDLLNILTNLIEIYHQLSLCMMSMLVSNDLIESEMAASLFVVLLIM